MFLFVNVNTPIFHESSRIRSRDRTDHSRVAMGETIGVFVCAFACKANRDHSRVVTGNNIQCLLSVDYILKEKRCPGLVIMAIKSWHLTGKQ